MQLWTRDLTIRNPLNIIFVYYWGHFAPNVSILDHLDVHFTSGVTQDPEPYFKEVKQTRTKEQIPVEAHVFGFKKNKNTV